ncbi:ATP phosphoribosyltransferase [Hirschia baltica]|uniref:ATP phosphoribosyltransferase n=1 Tax=Hirschia baltica (strain ATCC 49814 / DSM 5838 / IFAM 1418) TaxID=582402 RepID=C6XQP5_HIRBI|nr:ATP phosphoribosyltransferase [Hirschia baltica]ACT58651.1 ATP phosphoribosyltransferase [Hirschia baltica ATCC 49814]
MSKLILAIPSKGRLKDQTDKYLAEAGFKLKQIGGDRAYSAELKGVEGVEMRLMSASEIARGVLNGEIHLGVTGEDLLREKAPTKLENDVHLLKALGFGHANLIVAAPQSWIDVESMADLDEVGAAYQEKTGHRMRVATKYLRLAREFFAQKGVGHYRIVESAGATEGAPASGTAELIVDITSTGSTLVANGLKIIADGQILASEAQLAASKKADWNSQTLETLRALLDNIEARQRAKQLCQIKFQSGMSESVLQDIFDMPQSRLFPNGEAFCPSNDVQLVCRKLAAAGGAPVSVQNLEYIFEADNPVFKRFLDDLPQG